MVFADVVRFFFYNIYVVQGRTKKNKLWARIESITEDRSGVCGRAYRVKFVGVPKELWVPEFDLAPGVRGFYDNNEKLPKNAKPRVKRVFAEKQQEFLAKGKHESGEVEDPFRTSKRCANWIMTVQHFLQGISKVFVVI